MRRCRGWTGREAARWTFDPPDFKKFPLLKLAYEAQEAGGSATATLNAADEIAVEAFLAGEIPFPAIAATVAETLERIPSREPRTSRKCSKSIGPRARRPRGDRGPLG